ncbi:MAG: M56 family metallopeptidase [Limisphaerales bacterium]
MLIWLAGLAALLARSAWTHAGFAWLRLRHFLPAAEALRQRVQSLAARLGLRRRVRVLASERLRAPAAFGWVRPGVAVPGDFTGRFAPAQQDVMLAHELAHLAARDPLWQLLADLVTAALWWHPLAWVARRQHRIAGELAADDASLALPNGPVVLAECLLVLGHEAADCPRAALGMAGFRSQLGRRVERLLALPRRDWQAPSRARLALQTAVALLALAALALLPGCAANRTAGEAPSRIVTKWWQTKAKTTESQQLRAKLLRKLAETRLPEVTYDGIPLPEVLRMLEQDTKRYDPAKQGVQFAARPAITTSTPVLDPDLETVLIKIDTVLRDVSVLDALDAIVKTADVHAPDGGSAGLQYTIETNRVVFHPRATPAAFASPTKGTLTSRQRALLQRLDNIVIPEVIYDGLPLPEVIKLLAQDAKRHDPEKKGFNFLTSSGRQTGGIPGNWPDHETILIKLSSQLKQLTVRQVLEVICQTAEVKQPDGNSAGLRFTVEDYGIILTPRVPGQHYAPPRLVDRPAGAAVRTKLDQIILPHVSFDGLPLPEVIKRLDAEARKHDPAQLGVNLLATAYYPDVPQRLRPGPPKFLGVPLVLDPLTGKPMALHPNTMVGIAPPKLDANGFPTGGSAVPLGTLQSVTETLVDTYLQPDLETVLVRLTQPLTKASLRKVLDAIVKHSEVSGGGAITYRVEDHGVLFTPDYSRKGFQKPPAPTIFAPPHPPLPLATPVTPAAPGPASPVNPALAREHCDRLEALVKTLRANPATTAQDFANVAGLIEQALAEYAAALKPDAPELARLKNLLNETKPPAPKPGASLSPVAPPAVSTTNASDISVGRQLLVDDFLISSSTLKRTWHLPVLAAELPQEVVRAEKPLRGVFPFPEAVWYDASSQFFKMGFAFRTNTADFSSPSGTNWDLGQFHLHAEPTRLQAPPVVVRTHYESLTTSLHKPAWDNQGIVLGFERDGLKVETRVPREFILLPTPGDGSRWSDLHPMTNGFLVVGRNLYFYFGGRVQPMGATHASAAVGLATLRRDGFASLDAGPEGGVMTTKPVTFTGKFMFVNMKTNAPDGEMRIEILDADGNALEHFSRAKSIALAADQTLMGVNWVGEKGGLNDLSALIGKPVRFRFHLKNASLYSFWVGPGQLGRSMGRVAGGGPHFTNDVDTIGNASYRPFPRTTNAAPALPPKAGTIVVGDYLSVEVTHRQATTNLTMRMRVRVEPSGNLQLPVTKAVGFGSYSSFFVAGKTIEEARQSIRDALVAAGTENPVVTVTKVEPPPASPLTPASLHHQPTVEKLARIRFPEATYDGLPLPMVLKMLEQDTKRNDPAKQGVSFGMRAVQDVTVIEGGELGAKEISVPARNLDVTKAQSAGSGTVGVSLTATVPLPRSRVRQVAINDMDRIRIHVTSVLRDVSVLDALDAIVKTSEAAIGYTVETNGVVIHPRLPGREFVSPRVGTNATGATVRAKAEKLTLPEVGYPGLPLTEVVKFLIADTQKLDPEKRGLNFLVTSHYPGQPPGERQLFPLLDANGNPIPGTERPLIEPDLNVAVIRLAELRQNQTIAQTLDALCAASSLPITWRAEGFGILITPKFPAPGAPADHATQTYGLHLDRLLTALARELGRDKTTLSTNDAVLNGLLTDHLRPHGFVPPPGQPPHFRMVNGLIHYAGPRARSEDFARRVIGLERSVPPPPRPPKAQPAPKPGAPRGALPEAEGRARLSQRAADLSPADGALGQTRPTNAAPAQQDAQSKFLPLTVRAMSQVRIEMVNPGDSLKLTVAEDESFSAIYLVKADGNITLPRVGKVAVGGKRVNEARDAVKALLEATQLRTATVTVTFASKVVATIPATPPPFTIHFAGEFITTGPLVLAPDLKPTLLNAITRSGGITPNGDLTRVKLLRVKNGQGNVEEVNVASLLADKAKGDATLLQSGDIIMVPAMAPVVKRAGDIKQPAPVAADVRRLTPPQTPDAKPQTPPTSPRFVTSSPTNADGALGQTRPTNAVTPTPDPLQAAQEEAARRQERKLALDKLLGEAGQFQKIKSWTNAVVRFEEAVGLAKALGGVPAMEKQYRDALAGLIHCRLQLAVGLQENYQFKAAAAEVDKILPFYPGNFEAEQFKRFNERVEAAHRGRIPTQPALARQPQLMATRTEVMQLVRDGKLYWEMGDYRESKLKLEAAITKDPLNEAAFYYLRLVMEAEFDVENKKREKTYSDRVVEVTKKWNEQTRTELPVPNPYFRTNSQVPFLTHSSKGAQRINRKLEEIVLPEVHFDGVTLVEVLKRLDADAKQFDPEKKGLNFMINDVAPPAPLLDANGNPVPVARPVALSEGLIRISTTLRNLSLRQVLDVICKNAELPTQFSVEEYAIVFIPRGPGNAAYFSRTFRVNPDTFMQGLRGVVANPVVGQSVPAASPGGQAPTTTTVPVRATIPATVPATPPTTAEANALVRQFFQSAGVTALGATNSSTQVIFNPENGLLLVRGTTNDLRVIEQAIQKVQPPLLTPTSTNAPASPATPAPGKPVVKIETRIFERAEPLKNLTGVSLANTLRLDTPGLFTNRVVRAADIRSQFWPPLTTNQLPADGRMECEFYEARTQLAVVMSAARREALLKSLAAGREWTAPDVRLRDGQQGQSQSVEVSTVMVGTPPPANPRANAVNVTTGVTVDLWPKLSADSTSLQLGYVTDVREFLGYAHTTKSPPEAVPRFRVRQAIGTNTLAIGESLLLTVAATVPPPGKGSGPTLAGAERTLFVLLTATLDEPGAAAPERDRPGRSGPPSTNAAPRTALPNPYYKTNSSLPFLTRSMGGAQRISRKLDEIIIPDVHLDSVTLPEVVKWLDGAVRKFDPEKKGLNFLINNVASDYITPNATSAPAAPVLDQKGNPIATSTARQYPDLDIALIKVSKPIKDLTLRQVLDVICKTATVKMPDGRAAGLKFTIEEYAIVFSPKLPEQASLFPRTFKVDPETFIRGLAGVTSDEKLSQLGGRAEVDRLLRAKTWTNTPAKVTTGQFSIAGVPVTNSAKTGVSGVVSTNLTAELNNLVRDYFRAAGVTALGESKGPDATQIFLNDRNGLLLVRASLEDLDIIQQAIELLNTKPPQVLIEAKIVEMNQNDDKAVGFDWFLGNTAIKPPEVQPDGVRRVWIDREGNYKLDGRARSLDQIEDELKAVFRTNSGVVVRIGAEHETRYIDATPVFERLSRIGITNSSYAVAAELKLGSSRPPSTVNPTGVFPLPAFPSAAPASTGSLTNKLVRTNATPLGTITGILTAPQFGVVMRAFEQRDGASVRSLPKVTTTSGKQAVLELPAAAKAGGGVAQGLKLEVVPTVDANGYTIGCWLIVTRDGKQVLESKFIVWDAQTVMLGFSEPVAANAQSGAKPPRLLLFLTPTLVDPAGNRIHAPTDEMPFTPAGHPQPKPSAPEKK